MNNRDYISDIKKSNYLKREFELPILRICFPILVIPCEINNTS